MADAKRGFWTGVIGSQGQMWACCQSSYMFLNSERDDAVCRHGCGAMRPSRDDPNADPTQQHESSTPCAESWFSSAEERPCALPKDHSEPCEFLRVGEPTRAMLLAALAAARAALERISEYSIRKASYREGAEGRRSMDVYEQDVQDASLDALRAIDDALTLDAAVAVVESGRGHG